MKTSVFSKPVIAVANAVSAVMAPLFVPAYGTAIIMLYSSMAILPSNVRWTTLGVVLVMTAIIPLAGLYVMKRRGTISDIDVSDRSQRAKPVVLMLVCYVLTMAYIAMCSAPLWMVMYFASGIVTALTFGIITIAARWKISMHGAGMGNLIGLVLALWVKGHAPMPMPWLLTAILLATGLVGTSRVILNRHTLGQVFAGITLSAAITFFMI